MENLIKEIEKNWDVVSQAPLAFLIVMVAAFVAAYVAAAWKFSSQIEQLNSKNETLRERVLLKSEQADTYRERALKYDEKLLAVAQSDSSGLREKTLSFVAEVRAFIERHRRSDNLIHENEWVEMTQAKDEEEKQRLWHKFTSAMSRMSFERASEWERRFKVEAIMLRDELLSRQPDPQRSGDIASRYEHPVNYFCYCDVADDLERLAKLLPRASV